MSQQYQKLKTLLRELFQLDQPDLDFGFYRVMHAKSAEVTQFLERDLLPQVKTAFAQYQPADKATIEKELTHAIEQGRGLGADPEGLPKVKELRARLAQDAVDLDALEAEVYDHLYSFFRRYYSEGDFLSKRVYKPGVYAIPYEGEEVKLHWANADQYYIKTSEYLHDYAFRLRPDDANNPMRVHFRLVDGAEGEHGNVKEAAGKERRFKLAAETPVGVEGGELVIRFTYEPDPKKQRELNTASEERILGTADAAILDWIRALGQKHVRADGTESEATRFRVHLDRYTARNTFDYFIHKDLGGFLRRELDFYIKNEVMHLDDVESQTAPRVEQYLSKIKVIRSIAGKIIAFLAQLEDFQKRLWLKTKFVVETSWCIRVGCIPKEFYPEIVSNKRQLLEWHLFVEEAEIDSAGLSSSPTLTVDTRHFDAQFTARLLESIGNVDELTDGVLIHSDNFHALSLVQARHRGKAKCVYIDPPYNSKTSEIAYKNTYRHSSWLSLIDGRLSLSRSLSTEDGSHVIAIDENEQELLGQVLGLQFPTHERICIAVIHNKKGIQGDYFSHNHEYAYFCIPSALLHTRGVRLPESEWEYTNLRKWGRESERSTAKNCFYPIFVEDGVIVGFGEVSPDEFHPGTHNVAKGARTAVYPVDSGGAERKWRYARASVEGIRHLLRVHVTNSGEIQIHKAVEERPIKTVWDDSRYIAGDYGTKWLTDLGLKVREDLYPKSVHVVEDSVRAVSDDHSLVVDYFAGSGTTGHSVINLNRQDAGRRRFVLVEMGEYFDTVLLPRLERVTFTPEWKDGKPKRPATLGLLERGGTVGPVVLPTRAQGTPNNV